MIKKKKVDPGVWTRADIRDHLFYHMVDSGLEARRQIDELRLMQKSLKNRWYVRNSETGEEKVDKAATSEYHRAGKAITDLLKTKPEKNLNYNPLVSNTSGLFKMMAQEKRV